jgi:hypothetical protein
MHTKAEHPAWIVHKIEFHQIADSTVDCISDPPGDRVVLKGAVGRVHGGRLVG